LQLVGHARPLAQLDHHRIIDHKPAEGMRVGAQCAAEHTQSTPELLALELRESLDALTQLLGPITPDDILTQIFTTFCIGK